MLNIELLLPSKNVPYNIYNDDRPAFWTKDNNDMITHINNFLLTYGYSAIPNNLYKFSRISDLVAELNIDKIVYDNISTNYIVLKIDNKYYFYFITSSKTVQNNVYKLSLYLDSFTTYFWLYDFNKIKLGVNRYSSKNDDTYLYYKDDMLPEVFKTQYIFGVSNKFKDNNLEFERCSYRDLTSKQLDFFKDYLRIDGVNGYINVLSNDNKYKIENNNALIYYNFVTPKLNYYALFSKNESFIFNYNDVYCIDLNVENDNYKFKKYEKSYGFEFKKNINNFIWRYFYPTANYYDYGIIYGDVEKYTIVRKYTIELNITDINDNKYGYEIPIYTPSYEFYDIFPTIDDLKNVVFNYYLEYFNLPVNYDLKNYPDIYKLPFISKVYINKLKDSINTDNYYEILPAISQIFEYSLVSWTGDEIPLTSLDVNKGNFDFIIYYKQSIDNIYGNIVILNSKRFKNNSYNNNIYNIDIIKKYEQVFDNKSEYLQANNNKIQQQQKESLDSMIFGITSSITSAIGGAVTSGLSGNIGGAAMSGVNGVINTASNIVRHQNNLARIDANISDLSSIRNKYVSSDRSLIALLDNKHIDKFINYGLNLRVSLPENKILNNLILFYLKYGYTNNTYKKIIDIFNECINKPIDTINKNIYLKTFDTIELLNNGKISTEIINDISNKLQNGVRMWLPVNNLYPSSIEIIPTKEQLI